MRSFECLGAFLGLPRSQFWMEDIPHGRVRDQLLGAVTSGFWALPCFQDNAADPLEFSVMHFFTMQSAFIILCSAKLLFPTEAVGLPAAKQRVWCHKWSERNLPLTLLLLSAVFLNIYNFFFCHMVKIEMCLYTKYLGVQTACWRSKLQMQCYFRCLGLSVCNVCQLWHLSQKDRWGNTVLGCNNSV